MDTTHYDLLAALMGEYPKIPTVLHPVITKKELPNSTMLENVRSILGSSILKWAIALMRYAYANHYVSLSLPDGKDITDFSGLLPESTGNGDTGVLIASGKGVAAVAPQTVITDVWPHAETITVTKTGKNTVTITAGLTTWTAHFSKYKNRLDISWPKELGITGRVQLENDIDDFSFNLPILTKYPIKFVTNALTNSKDAYSLLEETDLVDNFFFADSIQEKLAIIVLAIYKYVFSR